MLSDVAGTSLLVHHDDTWLKRFLGVMLLLFAAIGLFVGIFFACGASH